MQFAKRTIKPEAGGLLVPALGRNLPKTLLRTRLLASPHLREQPRRLDDPKVGREEPYQGHVPGVVVGRQGSLGREKAWWCHGLLKECHKVDIGSF